MSMITLTSYNTCKKVYLDEKDIEKVVDGHDIIGVRSYPWSDVTVSEPDGTTKCIRVIESARQIGKLMSEAMAKKARDRQKTEEK